MPNADDDDTEASSAPKKAPIDQWLSGEISTICQRSRNSPSLRGGPSRNSPTPSVT